MSPLWQSNFGLVSLVGVLIMSVIGLSVVIMGIRHESELPAPQETTPRPIWPEILAGSLLQVPLIAYLALVH